MGLGFYFYYPIVAYNREKKKRIIRVVRTLLFLVLGGITRVYMFYTHIIIRIAYSNLYLHARPENINLKNKPNEMNVIFMNKSGERFFKLGKSNFTARDMI